MKRSTSVALTQEIAQTLRQHLLRDDGQEDLCVATYRPSTGPTRTTALIRRVIPPAPGDRRVHGNATVTADYIMRAAGIAQNEQAGLILLHSHPRSRGWQPMSGPDRVAEASYANLARELTGLPLVGMTIAGGDGTWSARHWDLGVGVAVSPTHCDSVRVIGDRLAVSWNNTKQPPPIPTNRQSRTISCWGEDTQADLARRRILIIGAGSVGLDVAVRLAASGAQRLGVMDFDVIETKNLDRMPYATRRDVDLRRPKTHVAGRETLRAATADDFEIQTLSHSICEPAGLDAALDYDVIFSCVDRPWPRAVLNALAYSDLIPVIDGGIAIDTLDGAGIRNATWRGHVIRPGRPCMSCNRQLDVGQVPLEIEGLLDDPTYIFHSSGASTTTGGQNVATLSVSVTALLLALYTSFSTAPGGIGEPGPLRYSLSTHDLEHLDAQTNPHCPYETAEAAGDQRPTLTGPHPAADDLRRRSQDVTWRIGLQRWVDDRMDKIQRSLPTIWR